LSSREHNPAIIVLPGAQSRDICAPGSTIQQCLCSREHNQAILVLPGAQSSRICAMANPELARPELARPELARPELAPPELMAVQMLLLYAPPEPEVCFHLLRDRCCSAIIPVRGVRNAEGREWRWSRWKVDCLHRADARRRATRAHQHIQLPRHCAPPLMIPATVV
jgi:hypothetical protein